MAYDAATVAQAKLARRLTPAQMEGAGMRGFVQIAPQR